METINQAELVDPNINPGNEVLKGILGRSFSVYESLLEIYEKNGMEHEWRYYKDGKAWLCKVQKKKKTIIWMSAWKGYMQATIYIPVIKISAILGLGISEELKENIKQTKDVGKSRPVIFKIRNKKILDDLVKVIRYKEEMK